MSRTLTRLREVTGDPLLVRAGRKMVLTPHAQNLKARTQNVVSEMRSVLNNRRAASSSDAGANLYSAYQRGVCRSFWPGINLCLWAQAPGVKLNFVAKSEKDRSFCATGTWIWRLGC